MCFWSALEYATGPQGVPLPASAFGVAGVQGTPVCFWSALEYATGPQGGGAAVCACEPAGTKIANETMVAIDAAMVLNAK